MEADTLNICEHLLKSGIVTWRAKPEDEEIGTRLARIDWPHANSAGGPFLYRNTEFHPVFHDTVYVAVVNKKRVAHVRALLCDFGTLPSQRLWEADPSCEGKSRRSAAVLSATGRAPGIARREVRLGVGGADGAGGVGVSVRGAAKGGFQ